MVVSTWGKKCPTKRYSPSSLPKLYVFLYIQDKDVAKFKVLSKCLLVIFGSYVPPVLETSDSLVGFPNPLYVHSYAYVLTCWAFIQGGSIYHNSH